MNDLFYRKDEDMDGGGRMGSNRNIDIVVNDLGYEIVQKINEIKSSADKKKMFNLIDKALGVLVNDGVYAYYVFCRSKSRSADWLCDRSQHRNAKCQLCLHYQPNRRCRIHTGPVCLLVVIRHHRVDVVVDARE